MNFIDAIKSVYNNYANFKGRALRSEYWWFFLYNFGISQLLSAVSPIVGLIFSLINLIPALAVGVRRMHDVAKSGWYLLIPIYNLVLACTEGHPDQNEWGPSPLSNELEDSVNAIGTNDN